MALYNRRFIPLLLIFAAPSHFAFATSGEQGLRGEERMSARATAANQDLSLAEIFGKFKSLESDHKKLALKLDQQEGEIAMLMSIIQEQQEVISKLENSQRRMQTSRCGFTYDATSYRCVFPRNVTFNASFEALDGMLVEGDYIGFADKVVMLDGLRVKGTSVELVSNKTTIDSGYVTVTGNVTLKSPVTFNSSADFEDNVAFEGSVDFQGGYGEVIFDKPVYFNDGQVQFDTKVEFHDDVLIEGPDGSQDDSLDFDIRGHVDADFHQKEELHINPPTKFYHDVKIRRKGERSSSDSDSSPSKDDKDDKDDWGDDTPDLYVEGDIIAGEDVTVGRNLRVIGDGKFVGKVNITGATYVQSTLNVTDKLSAQRAQIAGDTLIGGDLAVTGGISVASSTVAGGSTVGGDLSIGGAISSASSSVVGGASVGGDLTVTGAVSSASSSVSGSSTVGGDLTVTGAIAGASSTISGSSTVTGTLTAGSVAIPSGTLSVGGGASVGGDFDVAGTTNLGGDTSVAGNFYVAGAAGGANDWVDCGTSPASPPCP